MQAGILIKHSGTAEERVEIAPISQVMSASGGSVLFGLMVNENSLLKTFPTKVMKPQRHGCRVAGRVVWPGKPGIKFRVFPGATE